MTCADEPAQRGARAEAHELLPAGGHVRRPGGAGRRQRALLRHEHGPGHRETSDNHFGEVYCITDGTVDEAAASRRRRRRSAAIVHAQHRVRAGVSAARHRQLRLRDDGQHRLPARQRQLASSTRTAKVRAYTTPRNNDIWDCLDDGDDEDNLADACVKVMTLNDLTAESTGGIFDGTGKTLLREHPAQRDRARRDPEGDRLAQCRRASSRLVQRAREVEVTPRSNGRRFRHARCTRACRSEPRGASVPGTGASSPARFGARRLRPRRSRRRASRPGPARRREFAGASSTSSDSRRSSSIFSLNRIRSRRPVPGISPVRRPPTNTSPFHFGSLSPV